MLKLIILYIILFIIIIYLSYRSYFYNKIIKSNQKKDIKIIISRYNENLKWTLEEPFNKFKYIVYNKGNNDNFEKKYVEKIINLQNVGREGHTYLYHIINNYNNLSDINIFFPGSLEIYLKKNIATNLLYKILEYNQAITLAYQAKNFLKLNYNFEINYYEATSQYNKNLSKNSIAKSSLRPYGKWYEYHFNIINTNIFYFGIFSIDKKDILLNSISYYEKFLKELEIDSNPEVGHYIERSWLAIFNPLKYTIIQYDNNIYFIMFIYNYLFNLGQLLNSYIQT